MESDVLPVDGGEGEGADVEGVAGVVLQLHFVRALLLAQRQHLPCLRRNLQHATILVRCLGCSLTTSRSSLKSYTRTSFSTHTLSHTDQNTMKKRVPRPFLEFLKRLTFWGLAVSPN